MHYFKFDIATWIQSTRHLTPEEEGVYLRLVNHYYDTEKPLPVEIQPVLKRLQLRGHLDLVNEILTDFFVLTEKGWSHNKCNELLKEYHKGTKKNKLNGQKGGRPSKTKASSVTQKEPSGLITETQTEPKHNPNYELVTKNEELITKDIKASKIPPCPHDEIIDLYHKILPELQSVKMQLWTGTKRDKDLRDRWRQSTDFQDLRFWEWYFLQVKKSRFHMGENERGWKADLAWLIKKENFTKQVEAAIQ